MKALFITAAALLFSAGAYAAGITIDTSATNTDISAVTGSITIDGSAIGGGGGEAAFTAESTPGTTPTATGTDAIGIGDAAVAGDDSGDGAVVAIGASSSAIGVSSVAIGRYTDAGGANSIAIGGGESDGDSADATGAQSIAIGNDANATAARTLAIGFSANASVIGAVAIGGLEPSANASYAIAIGNYADATGANCIAIGGHATDASSADCTASGSIAIGILTDSIGTDSVALGNGAQAGDATGDNAVLAIGASSLATGLDSIAIGQNSDATGSESIAIGGDPVDADSANAIGSRNVAIGHKSDTDGTGSVAVGNGAQATTHGAVSVGDSARATAEDTISIGQDSQATSTGNIAIGANSAAYTGTYTVAIGKNVSATANNCIAIGGNNVTSDSADCTAADSVAIGQHILADDIGEFAFASGEFAAQSDAHRSWYVLRNNTTDATQTELFADASAGDISVGSDCSMSGFIRIVARRTDADGETAHYTIEWTVDNNAGTTALVGAVSVVTVAEDTAAWTVTATADNSNDGINILVTGEASKTIRWVGAADVTYVCG